MSRRAKINDFNVDVDGIGTFIFAKRTMADEINIQVAYARIIQGAEPTEWLSRVGGWISTLNILTVKAPNGWDIDDMDPLDDDVYENIMLVYLALRAQENSFRTRSGKGSKESGEKQSQDNRLLVPEAVPANGE